jgi:hypothetical protein
MINDDDKRAIAEQAAAYFKAINPQGDGTEALAGLYAAAQVIERTLLAGGHCDPRYLLLIQAVGKRVGAAMDVKVDMEVVGNKDVC